jgi:hypothetical protein
MRTFLIGLLFVSASAFGLGTPPPSCSIPEFSQLDFWLGNWDLRWEAFPGIAAGTGTNHITRDYDGCVTEERFEGDPLKGHSISTYFAPSKQWRQTWVDNQGSYIVLAGGPSAGEFILITPSRPGSAAANRMVFTDITPNRFTWRWQATQDGKTWSDSWVIRYSRKRS